MATGVLLALGFATVAPAHDLHCYTWRGYAQGHGYTVSRTISIKALHGATGEIVRRAGASRTPIVITDNGEPVAILANPRVVTQSRPRRAGLLPEFTAMLKRGAKTDVQAELDAVRGDR